MKSRWPETYAKNKLLYLSTVGLSHEHALIILLSGNFTIIRGHFVLNKTKNQTNYCLAYVSGHLDFKPHLVDNLKKGFLGTIAMIKTIIANSQLTADQKVVAIDTAVNQSGSKKNWC